MYTEVVTHLSELFAAPRFEPTPAVLVALACLVVVAASLAGYLLGAHRARRERRTLRRDLATREIALLDARADAARLDRLLADAPRRERVLRLALRRLKDARDAERRRYVETARLRLALAESDARRKEALRLASRATRRARALEERAGASGTITTRAPKSCGSGEPVTVNVVDRGRPDTLLDGAARLPDPDRAVLARRSSSNGGRRRGGVSELAAVEGLSDDDARRLAAHGIHRLEQLASLTERELREMLGTGDAKGSPRVTPAAWIGRARALLESRTIS